MTRLGLLPAMVLIGSLTIWSDASIASQSDDSPPGREQFDFPSAPKTENVIAKYVRHDFSSILVPRSEFLGFIGEGYRRLRIHFYNVHRDESDPTIYHVTGRSEVAGVSDPLDGCQFRGTITVSEVREYGALHYGVDDYYRSQSPQAQGVLVGKFHFVEEREQRNRGIFEGVMAAQWMLDRFGVMLYDDIELPYSDPYWNNQYVGTWTSNKSGQKKVANWGEYRIPNSGDLDIGAGEFGANPKYRSMGWVGPDVEGFR